MIVTLAYEKSVEDLAQVGIMRLVVKAKRTNMVEISVEFP